MVQGIFWLSFKVQGFWGVLVYDPFSPPRHFNLEYPPPLGITNHFAAVSLINLGAFILAK